MKPNNQAFTLIELLVVVLIIGIVAAVAVPQYTQAVNKSRAVQAITMLKSITDAQEAYFLANGEYTPDLTKLDIDVPENMRGKQLNASESENPNQYLFVCPGLPGKSCHAWASSSDLPRFEVVLPHTTISYVANYRGVFWCNASGKTNRAKNICTSIGTPSYADGYYRIN
ncbi:MAG: prepilin-type N-terminal cleavage/methylation domain-containing protein [Elusimicrobiaceae bacterium]|nr:prepilin-type N-terminal cleavage/methylation domain-containing protein [Elusimicrobiaceae bacterium]